MKKKLPLWLVLALVLVVAAGTFSIGYSVAMGRFNQTVADVNERQAMYQKLSEVDQAVRQTYADEIDEEALQDSLAAGYVAGLLDADAQYLNAEQYAAYLAGHSENSVGIGVRTIRNADGNMEVVAVDNGSPAWDLGLQKGDVIVAVDGDAVLQLGYTQAESRLYGKVGSTVTLLCYRPAGSQGATEPDAAEGSEEQPGQSEPSQTQESFELELTREDYQSVSVQGEVLDGAVGYVKIFGFYAGTAEQFNTVLEELQQQPMTGLVIDLRGNTGGNLEEVEAVLDTLLPEGDLVRSMEKDGTVTVVATSDEGQLEVPVHVLVNSGTKGLGEIFAAAVADYQKGEVVGEQTPGETTRIKEVPLSDGNALLLPSGHYLPPVGEDITGTGVTPTQVAELPAELREQLDRNTLATEEDAQLQAALALFQ